MLAERERITAADLLMKAEDARTPALQLSRTHPHVELEDSYVTRRGSPRRKKMTPFALRRTVQACLIAVICGANIVSCRVEAQLSDSYPNRPIHVIVPFAPGAADVYIRALGPALEAELGQPIVVENRAGANGLIGADAVKRTAADGYTFLFATASVVATRFFRKDVTLDVCKDFVPVNTVHESPMVLVASPTLGVKSVAELIEHARRNPGKLTFASAGIGSIQHLSAELFKNETKTDLVHVPYNGGTVFIPDLITGRVDLAFSTLGTLVAQIGEKKLVPLAVLGNAPHKDLPGVPPITEALPNYQKVASWSTMLAPLGLPDAIRNRVHQAVSKALAKPDIQVLIEKNYGLVLDTATSADVGKLICSESERLDLLTRKIGLQPD